MHLICSYCGRYIKEKKPIEVTRTTHGICLDCNLALSKQDPDFSYDEYLETFDAPVVIVDSHQRVFAANQTALGMMHKSIDRVCGLLGGEALECVHARLPQGCGRTIHCETCAIRNLVMKTLETRRSFDTEHVSMETGDGRRDFWISTIFCDDLVQIVFEEHVPGSK